MLYCSHCAYRGFPGPRCDVGGRAQRIVRVWVAVVCVGASIAVAVAALPRVAAMYELIQHMYLPLKTPKQRASVTLRAWLCTPVRVFWLLVPFPSLRPLAILMRETLCLCVVHTLCFFSLPMSAIIGVVSTIRRPNHVSWSSFMANYPRTIVAVAVTVTRIRSIDHLQSTKLYRSSVKAFDTKTVR